MNTIRVKSPAAERIAAHYGCDVEEVLAAFLPSEANADQLCRGVYTVVRVDPRQLRHEHPDPQTGFFNMARGRKVRRR